MKHSECDPQSWLEYASADIESAKILLETTHNYHIVTYHAHQAIEKVLKRYLFIHDKKFPFIHELVALRIESDVSHAMRIAT